MSPLVATCILRNPSNHLVCSSQARLYLSDCIPILLSDPIATVLPTSTVRTNPVDPAEEKIRAVVLISYTAAMPPVLGAKKDSEKKFRQRM